MSISLIIIGTIAITAGSIRLLPQIIKSFKTQEVDDLSMSWEIIGLISSVFWTIYGVMISDNIVIIGSVIPLVFFLILIYQKSNY